jgi:hypothetical protein
MDMRLGGLEASMKLILDYLQIPLLKGNITRHVVEHVKSEKDNSAIKQPDEEVSNALERWQEVYT